MFAVRRAAFASQKRFSATAPLRSSFPFSRRPLSRPDIPPRPSRSGEGIDSARRHPCPENVGNPKFLPYLSASTGPASSRADPDHASSFSPRPNCQKKPPPHLINQSRSRPDRRHASFRPTPRRRIRENPVMYSSPLRVYRSFHCAPCG